MNEGILKIVCAGSLSLAFAVAMGQHASGGGGSSSHGGGGGGGSFSHSGGYSGGGYSSSRGSSGYSGGYSGHYSGGYSGRPSYGSGNYGGSHVISGSTSRGGSYGGGSYSRSAGSYGSHSNLGGTQFSSRYSNTRGGSEAHDPASFQGRSGPSRSGTPAYKTNNNLHTGAANEGVRSTIGTAPQGRLSGVNGILGRGGRGGEGGFRHGYYGYHGWRDAFWFYPFYLFDPFFDACFCSPWYYYGCLPPYIGASRCIIVDSWPSTNWTGDDYNWQPSGTPSGQPALDSSIQDIIGAFENADHKAIEKLIPRTGNVNMYVDGKYSYSLAANDFYDTYVDGIEGTKTDRFEILNVKSNANGTARVSAKHVYTDPYGKRAFVYQSYFLVKEGGNYVIREFGTSNYKAN